MKQIKKIEFKECQGPARVEQMLMESLEDVKNKLNEAIERINLLSDN